MTITSTVSAMLDQSRCRPLQGNVTQPLQPGDQICTEAQTLPGVMHHGIVYTCNKASITVGHFYDRGVWEAALFGSKGFTTGQVYLVDDWANKDGAAPTVSRDTTVCRVRKELANNDTARSMYNISLFNCEHWATMMRLADQSRRFSRQVHDFKEHESIWDRLGVLRFAVGVTGGAKSVRG